MTLKYSDIKGDLDKVFSEMVVAGVEPEIVAHIGSKTRPLGLHFSERFGCGCIEVPSMIRKGKNRTLARIVNSIYPHFPETVLRSIAERYKEIYLKSERKLPDFPLNGLSEGHLPALLVDDNCFTGKTLNMWKQHIEEDSGRKVYTFAVAVTGDVVPDFYCINGWRSFEWRPIGM